ncbi:MAG: leucyl aminopeptidase family protein [Bdellovibrionia bacterium]
MLKELMRLSTQHLLEWSKQKNFLTSTTLLLLNEKSWGRLASLDGIPEVFKNRLTQAKSRAKAPLKAGETLLVQGTHLKEEDLWVCLLPENIEMYFLLEFARDILKQVVHTSDEKLSIVMIDPELNLLLAEAFGAALAARVLILPVYGLREKLQKKYQLKELDWISSGEDPKLALIEGYASGEGTHLARYLATLPPNFLNAKTYGETIRKLAKQHNLSCRFYSKSQLKKMGAGAFTAVDQGNPSSDGGIYELSYSPKGSQKKKQISLVGKGICYDTGGYDIKVGGNMATMKGDMQGSSVALATLIAASKLKLPVRMNAFLAVTENHISPLAYKADEVVTALNGMTIEVVNTDAEGRMVLADTLTLACRDKPDCVISFATLTGSAVRAIGTKYSAGFTNREKFHDTVKSAGTRSGERVWTFPIDSTFGKALESKIADILQCVKGPGPDHIFAAYFLSRFVSKTVPWVHIDLSASENEGGIGHVDSLFTGFGVRWALQFLKYLVS